jgi:hypothetical protein
MMVIAMSEQVQEQLGKTELVVITERVDDVALLLAQMMNMGLPEVLDSTCRDTGSNRA